jgi:nucleotide-binding universal stress UspA family protein
MRFSTGAQYRKRLGGRGMFRSIVVPLDGSELAERALPYAVQLARAGDGALTLLRVAIAPPPARLDGADWESEQAQAVQEAEAYLASAAEKLATRVPVTTRVAYGRAPQQILDTVEQTGAEAVVMATHGRTGLPHLVYGSVAEVLLASSRVPVLLVHARPGEAASAPFDPVTARIAVALDGSRFAESAVHSAASLVGPRGELVLVCIVEPPEKVRYDEYGRVVAYLDQQEEARTRAARDYLFNVAVEIGRQYPGVQISQDVRFGEASPGIIAAAIDKAIDLVVMSTHGRTGVSRAMLGSVAGDVVVNGTTPVMLVGPHEAHLAAALAARSGAPSGSASTA